jgi:hypothetical protein
MLSPITRFSRVMCLQSYDTGIITVLLVFALLLKKLVFRVKSNYTSLFSTDYKTGFLGLRSQGVSIDLLKYNFHLVILLPMDHSGDMHELENLEIT